jgi:uncharacterized protein
MNNSADDISWILAHCKTIAVVGLSPHAHRESHDVAQVMQAQGYRIIPVNPNAQTILGEVVYKTLTEAAEHEHIDLVNVFRNSADVPPVVEEAIATGAKAVWLQMGIAHEAAAAQARAAGLHVVQDLCIKVEYRRWAATSEGRQLNGLMDVFGRFPKDFAVPGRGQAHQAEWPTP